MRVRVVAFVITLLLSVIAHLYLSGSQVANCTYNEGFAFGILDDLGVVFNLVVAISGFLFVAGVLWWGRGDRGEFGLYEIGGVVLLLGGLLNLSERMVSGVVCDYLGIGLLSLKFNIPDLMVVVGVLMLIYFTIRRS